MANKCMRDTKALRDKGAKPEEIYQHALHLGYLPYVAKDASGIEHRADVLRTRSVERAVRKKFSDAGRKHTGKPYRRILAVLKVAAPTMAHPDAMREYHFHTTKGPRTYRHQGKGIVI